MSEQKRLEDLQPGDPVVISKYGMYNHPYRISAVERVTKTRIIVDNVAFMKSTGIRVGESDTWYKTGIARRRGFVMSVEEARKENESIQQELTKRELINTILGARRRQLETLETEILQQAAALLQLVAD